MSGMDKEITLEPQDIVKYSDENGYYKWYNDFKSAFDNINIKETMEVA